WKLDGAFKKYPGNTIVLDAKNQSVEDQVDALIFESCNAERKQRYAELKDGLMNPPPNTARLSVQTYAKRKALTEGCVYIKSVQLVLEQRRSGITVAPQGNRNLFRASLAVLDKKLKENGGEAAIIAQLVQDDKDDTKDEKQKLADA